MSSASHVPLTPGGRPGRPGGPAGRRPAGSVRAARLRRLRLVLPLLAGVVLEVAAVVLVAGWIGVLPTALLLVASTVGGVALLGREGRRSWRAALDAARSGRPPADDLLDGVLVVVGAGLMIVPGLVNGLVGLLLLVARPVVRRPLRALLMRRARRYGVPAGSWPTPGGKSSAAPGAAGRDDVVRGEVVDPDEGPRA